MADLIAGLRQLDVDLSVAVALRQQLFLAELLRWNKSVNLTSIRSLDEAVEKHLIDSLVLLPHLTECDTLLDMGSGGGLPGIPLAIARPELAVTSVDSVGKKINFQKHIKRKLQLPNLQLLHSRVEDLRQNLTLGDRFEAVTARAFSSLEVICSLAEPWLKAEGQLLVMKGPEGLAELSVAEALDSISDFYLAACHQYKLPFSGAERQLLVLKKQIV